MKVRNLLVKLVKDENGGEVLEYALIAGLIVVAAIAAISAVGGKVLARWNSLSGASFEGTTARRFIGIHRPGPWGTRPGSDAVVQYP